MERNTETGQKNNCSSGSKESEQTTGDELWRGVKGELEESKNVPRCTRIPGKQASAVREGARSLWRAGERRKKGWNERRTLQHSS